MSQAGGDLLKRLLRVELADKVGEGGGLVDEVEEGCGAEFERYVEEGIALLFAEVPDDVRMVVRLLQEVDLVRRDGDKVLE